MSASPTAAGFKVIFRRPAIPAAEIAWRWSFAAAAWFLAVFFLIAYADSLPVRTLDRILLGSQQPVLVLRALHRIFHGSAMRFVEGGVALAIGLGVIWVALSILGRTATVHAMREDLSPMSESAPERGVLASLLGLNFLRVAITVAALICAVGAILISGTIWASTHISLQDATRLCFAVLFITWIAWQALNWFLSTAGLFAIADGESAFDAIASTVSLCQRRPAQLFVTSTWFALGHFAAFVIASVAGVFTFGAIGALRTGPILFLELLLFLGYCAVVDFLHAGRLAAYLAIIGGEGTSEVSQGGLPAGLSAVDQSELILSDIPPPAF